MISELCENDYFVLLLPCCEQMELEVLWNETKFLILFAFCVFIFVFCFLFLFWICNNVMLIYFFLLRDKFKTNDVFFCYVFDFMFMFLLVCCLLFGNAMVFEDSCCLYCLFAMNACIIGVWLLLKAHQLSIHEWDWNSNTCIQFTWQIIILNQLEESDCYKGSTVLTLKWWANIADNFDYDTDAETTHFYSALFS